MVTSRERIVLLRIALQEIRIRTVGLVYQYANKALIEDNGHEKRINEDTDTSCAHCGRRGVE